MVWSQYYQSTVTQLLYKSLLKVCQENVPFSDKLEIDGIVCISCGGSEQMVIKIHEVVENSLKGSWSLTKKQISTPLESDGESPDEDETKKQLEVSTPKVARSTTYNNRSLVVPTAAASVTTSRKTVVAGSKQAVSLLSGSGSGGTASIASPSISAALKSPISVPSPVVIPNNIPAKVPNCSPLPLPLNVPNVISSLPPRPTLPSQPLSVPRIMSPITVPTLPLSLQTSFPGESSNPVSSAASPASPSVSRVSDLTMRSILASQPMQLTSVSPSTDSIKKEVGSGNSLLEIFAARLGHHDLVQHPLEGKSLLNSGKRKQSMTSPVEAKKPGILPLMVESEHADDQAPVFSNGASPCGSSNSDETENGSKTARHRPPRQRVPVMDELTGRKFCEYVCKLCPEKTRLQFELYTELDAHIERVHRRYTCRFCLSTFTLSCNLKRHMRLHNGQKPYHCPECGNAFSRNSDLKIHLEKHKIDPSNNNNSHSNNYNSSAAFSCMTSPNLSSSFGQAIPGRFTSELINTKIPDLVESNVPSSSTPASTSVSAGTTTNGHMSGSSSEGSVNSRCSSPRSDDEGNLCIDESFVLKEVVDENCNKQTLSVPRRRKPDAPQRHLQKDASVTNNAPQKKVEFTCQDCVGQFQSFELFEVHCMQRHHRFPCEFCGQTFSNKNNCSRHTSSTHLGDRPYSCDDCGRSFSRSDTLREHFATHSESPSKKNTAMLGSSSISTSC